MQRKMHNKEEGIKRREQIAVIKLHTNREVAHKKNSSTSKYARNIHKIIVIYTIRLTHIKKSIHISKQLKR